MNVKVLGVGVGVGVLSVVVGCSTATLKVDDPCRDRSAGDLIITEVMIDPRGADTGGEWIELFNPRDSAIDLTGLDLTTRRMDGSALKRAHLSGGVVDAHTYFTVGDARGGALPEWLDGSYGSALGSLGLGELTVQCGELVLDRARVTKPVAMGRSRMLDGTFEPDATSNDDEARWCDAPQQELYGAQNAGSPGLPNSRCSTESAVETCLENGEPRPVNPPQPGELIITEVMADPRAAADATGEWIELLALTRVDLNGLTLVTKTASSTLVAPTCLTVEAAGYALLAKSADPTLNGGLPAPLATFNLSLNNHGGPLRLVVGDAGIDSAMLPAATAGVSSQVDPLRLPAASANDEPTGFCRPSPTARFAGDGGDLGTPGIANSVCPGPPDLDHCLDEGGLRPLDSPRAGDLVITEFMADPEAVADRMGEWLEVLAKRSVDLNGLEIAVDDTTSVLAAPICLRAEAGSFLLVAHSDDASLNGGLPDVTATFDVSLPNSGLHTIVLRSDAGELDRLEYQRTLHGASSQLSAGLVDPTDNDLSVNVCSTPTSRRFGLEPDGGPGDGGFSGDRGTPGAPNVACP